MKKYVLLLFASVLAIENLCYSVRITQVFVVT